MSEWKEVVLGELVVKITKGTTPPNGKGFIESKGVNYIKSDSIEYDGTIDKSKFVQIDEETHELFKRSQLEEDDILFSMAGNYLGKSGIVTKEMLPANTNQALAIIRLDKKLALPQFIGYCFRRPDMIKYVNSMSAQSAQPNINFQEIASLQIKLPKIQEQCEIVKVLGTIDQKITLLRQQNQDLEELAQTLFKRWFVEFEFPVEVKGKKEKVIDCDDNENLLPITSNFLTYKSSGGKMVESELGEIPEGWRVGCLKDITSLITRGISPKYIEDGGICVLNQRCIRNKSIDFSVGRRHDSGLKNATSKFIEPYDVLVNSTGEGTLGRTAIVKRIEEEPTTVDSHVSIIRANNKINKYFLSYLITGREREIERMAEGTTGQTELSRTKLNEMEVLIPNRGLQDIFGNISLCYNQKISANEQEIQTLTQLRDTLLPKLMSGELRVQMDKD